MSVKVKNKYLIDLSIANMYAIIRKGKRKGTQVEISQWCNDWFSTTEGNILSPSNLAFTAQDIITITGHDNNGILLHIYEIVDNVNREEYCYSFKKRKLQ